MRTALAEIGMNNVKIDKNLTGSPMTFHDPATMTGEARIIEIATILSAGYRRLSIVRDPREYSLDDLSPSSPHANTVNGSESREEAA